MSSSRTVPLIALLLSAVVFAAVMMNPSTTEAHRAGLSGAAVPSTSVGSIGEPASHPFLESGNLPVPQRLPEPGGDPRHGISEGEDVGGADDLSTPRVAGFVEPVQTATLEELDEFREFVSHSLSEIRQAEAAPRLRSLELKAVRLDETMPGLADRLELTPSQSDRMRSVLLSRLDLEAEYWRQWGQGADEAILAELKARDDAAHRHDLAQFLTPAQMRAYLLR